MDCAKSVRHRATRHIGTLFTAGILAIIPLKALAGDPPQPTVDDITSIFKSTYATTCATLTGETKDIAPTEYTLHFRYDFDDAAAPPQTLTLYAFDCFRGAYNFGSVFFSVNTYGEITPLSFAFPDLAITRANPEDFESAVNKIEVTGFYANPLLMYPDVNVQKGTIDHYMKWRGLGDASESGTWRLKNGRFVLTRFAVDAAYDGESDLAPVYPSPQP